MEIGPPLKKRRSSHHLEEGRGSEGQHCLRKRKWSDEEEEEEEEEEAAEEEEEELHDSSDDDDDGGGGGGGGGNHQERKKKSFPSSSSSSPTVLVSFPATSSKPITTKLQRTTLKRPDTRDIPRARLVLVRFLGAKETVEAKIICKEPWGVRVEMCEDRPDLGFSIGARYWARFTGAVSPITNIPLFEVIHRC